MICMHTLFSTYSEMLLSIHNQPTPLACIPLIVLVSGAFCVMALVVSLESVQEASTKSIVPRIADQTRLNILKLDFIAIQPVLHFYKIAKDPTQ